MKKGMFQTDAFWHYKMCYGGEKKERLTKPCGTIKVTHIPGFITIKTYANVTVSPMGIIKKYFTGFFPPYITQWNEKRNANKGDVPKEKRLFYMTK